MSIRNKKTMANRIGEFLRLYGRKAQRGVEPNDRPYNPKIEQRLNQMKPEEVSALINGDEDANQPYRQPPISQTFKQRG